MRAFIFCGFLLWAGSTLLLSELPWFHRRRLTERVRPYIPGGRTSGSGAGGVLSVRSFREVMGPLASGLGEWLARLTGINEPLPLRLHRLHLQTDPTSFRLRQLGWACSGAALAALVMTIVGVAPLVGLALVLGGGLLGMLLVEQQLANQSDAWRKRVFLELPIVAEQLGMLLSAGYSMGSAINRLASRGVGASGADLRRVTLRIRQGLSEVDALEEWASVVGVDAVDRLVAVLALNREAGDLGRLISEESRSIRREVQRDLIESIERRSQQVWIPVTVATLVPGVLFLAVPFIEALRVFSGE